MLCHGLALAPEPQRGNHDAHARWAAQRCNEEGSEAITAPEVTESICGARPGIVDSSTLRRWRTGHIPQGPAFVKMSSRVTMYSGDDVRRWLLSRRIDPERAA